MRTCAPLALLGLCPKLKYPPLCGGMFIIMLHIPKPNLHILLEKNVQITQITACVSAHSAL